MNLYLMMSHIIHVELLVWEPMATLICSGLSLTNSGTFVQCD